MKGQDLYEALSHLDPAVVEAAAEPPRQRRVWRRPAMIAACSAVWKSGFWMWTGLRITRTRTRP